MWKDIAIHKNTTHKYKRFYWAHEREPAHVYFGHSLFPTHNNEYNHKINDSKRLKYKTFVIFFSMQLMMHGLTHASILIV